MSKDRVPFDYETYDADRSAWKLYDGNNYEVVALFCSDDSEDHYQLKGVVQLSSDKPQYSDASVTILSSSNKPYFKFKYYDCFPTSLSTFIMGANDSPDTAMSADATFRYSYYDIEKLF